MSATHGNGRADARGIAKPPRLLLLAKHLMIPGCNASVPAALCPRCAQIWETDPPPLHRLSTGRTVLQAQATSRLPSAASSRRPRAPMACSSGVPAASGSGLAGCSAWSAGCSR